jgi:hypothetical protein
MFSTGVGVKFVQSYSKREARPIHEEIYQTLLTHKKQETLTKYTPTTLLSNLNSHLPREIHFLSYKII